jgi:predicted TIM-barrel fold metal-dependent hydrolase
MAEQVIDWRFISADSHVVEPRDLFVSRAGAAFRDRVPRIESDDTCDWLVIEGLTRRPIGIEGAMIDEVVATGATTNYVHRYEENRPGATAPAPRLEDQLADNVVAEVVYPGMGLLAAGTPDPTVKAETFRIYNDWLGREFVAESPKRLLGAGLLPIGGDIEVAVAEARRCTDLGLRAFQLPAHPPGRSYEDPYFEPLWSALDEIGLPVSFHVGSGEDAFGYAYASMAALAVPIKYRAIETVAQLVFGGVLDRHPRLRVVLVESGIGWLASVMTYMDHWWGAHRNWLDPRLPEKPSTYVHRQVWATFEDDRSGLLTLPMLNEDHLMWGNDYPHTEGVWPNSVGSLERDLTGLTPAQQRKVTRTNAADLYGISLD